ncbi:unnamed protein product [Jaminaea pallidilutea]
MPDAGSRHPPRNGDLVDSPIASSLRVDSPSKRLSAVIRNLFTVHRRNRQADRPPPTARPHVVWPEPSQDSRPTNKFSVLKRSATFSHGRKRSTTSHPGERPRNLTELMETLRADQAEREMRCLRLSTGQIGQPGRRQGYRLSSSDVRSTDPPSRL